MDAMANSGGGASSLFPDSDGPPMPKNLKQYSRKRSDVESGNTEKTTEPPSSDSSDGAASVES